MKKYLFIMLFVVLHATLFSQTTNEIVQKRLDSLKNIVNGLSGSRKVDALNNMANELWWLLDVDTSLLHEASIYATKAFNDAKKIGYKKGLGYAYIQLENCEAARATDMNGIDEHYKQAEELAKRAVTIGQELNDNLMIGSSYNALIWLERWKGHRGDSKRKDYLKNVISIYEKLTREQLISGIFQELNVVDCPGCKGNEFILGDSHKDLGGIYANEHKLDSARWEIDLAITYYKKINDDNRLGDLYSDIGSFYFFQNNYDSSEVNSKRAFSFYQHANNIPAQIAVYTEICKVFDITGDFEKWLAYSKRDISLVESLDSIKPTTVHTKFWGQAFFWMSRLYADAGDYESALNIIQRGHKYYPHDDSLSTILWTSQIGSVFRLMKNYDSAMYYLERYEKSNPGGNNLGVVSLGYLYIDLKKYDKALQVIKPDVEYLRRVNIKMPPLASGLIIMASAYLGKKDYTTALQYAREAYTDLKIMKGNVLMIDDDKLLSDIFYKMGYTDSAYHYLKQYTILKDSLLNRQFYWNINNYKKEAEEAKKEAQIGFLNRDNKIKEQQLRQESFVKKFLIIGLLLLSLAVIFIYRSFTLKRRNEKLLREKMQTEFQQRAVELEMQALRTQMNPHFIFNCLTSINSFILNNEGKMASNYLTRFSRLMRMVLLNSQKKAIVLDDELEMLGLYLEMERLRFKDSFDYSINFLNRIDSDNIFIPPLLLQPFCENAIWHGLMNLPDGKQGKEEQRILTIELSMKDDILLCTIADNGVGRAKAAEFKSKSAEKGKSMGLQISSQRLALLNQNGKNQSLYTIEDLLDENNNVAGTLVTIRINSKEAVEQMI